LTSWQLAPGDGELNLSTAALSVRVDLGDGAVTFLDREGGGRVTAVGGLHQAGQGDDQPQEQVGARDHRGDRHAGQHGGLLVAADGVELPPRTASPAGGCDFSPEPPISSKIFPWGKA
jgi:hypothetical protein